MVQGGKKNVTNLRNYLRTGVLDLGDEECRDRYDLSSFRTLLPVPLAVCFLLATFLMSTSQATYGTQSLLHAAVKSKNLDMMELLIHEGGLSVNVVDIHGQTPFHCKLSFSFS